MFSITKLSLTQKDAIRGAALFDERGPRSMCILATLPTKRALVRFRLAEERQGAHYLTEDGLKAAFLMLADQDARLARAHAEALEINAGIVACGFCGKRGLPLTGAAHSCWTIVDIATGIVAMARQLPASKISFRSSCGVTVACDVIEGKTMPQDVPAERLLALADLGKLFGDLLAGSTIEDDHEVAIEMDKSRTPSNLVEARKLADEILALGQGGSGADAVVIASAVTLAAGIKAGCFTGVTQTGLETLVAYRDALKDVEVAPATVADPRTAMVARLGNLGLKAWSGYGDRVAGTVDERFYINKWAELVGFEVDYYHSGNVRSASVGGEAISNRAAKDILGARYWVKVARDGSLAFDYSGSREARHLLPTVEAKLRALLAPAS